MKNKIKISIIILILTLAITTQVFGAVAIKPTGNVYTSITLSNAFDQCLAMKASGGALAGSNVDVHMANGKEWGTVSYFSNSPYGTNTVGQNTGIAITVGGTQYLSTNGNATGVMDWGKTVSYTASVVSVYNSINTSGTAYSNGRSVIENAGTSLVDLFSASTPPYSVGANTWYHNNSWCVFDGNTDEPFAVRNGLFGFIGGKKWGHDGMDGKANNAITFRPVFFNP